MNIRKLLPSVLLITALSLSSCSSSETEPDKSDSVSSGISESAQTETPDPLKFDTSATIEPTVIFDSDGIRVTAQNLTYNVYEAELEVLIENSSDKKYSYFSGTAPYGCNSINGYMVENGYLESEIEAGAEVTETVYFSFEELYIYGISSIADIRLGLCFSDEEGKCIFTGETPVLTSLADSYDYSRNYFAENIESKKLEDVYGLSIEKYSTEEILNHDGVRIVSSMILCNSGGQKSLVLDIVNDTDQIVFISLGNPEVNGTALDSGLYGDGYIYPGAHMISTSGLYSEDGSFADVSESDSIGFTLDSGVYYRTDLKENKFTENIVIK